MWVSTKIVIDMNTLETVHVEGFEYNGPVARCKGGGKGGKGGGGDPYAAQRAAEEKRKAEAASTISNMESTFDSTFTDDYWTDYENQLSSYYYPEAEKQYATAMSDLKSQLGGTQSSSARKLINDLKTAYSQSKDTLAAQIASEVATDQSRIAGKKTDLTSTINLSSDPANAVGDVGNLVSGLAIPAAPSALDTGLGALVSSWITGKIASNLSSSGSYSINPYQRSTGSGSTVVK